MGPKENGRGRGEEGEKGQGEAEGGDERRRGKTLSALIPSSVESFEGPTLFKPRVLELLPPLSFARSLSPLSSLASLSLLRVLALLSALFRKSVSPLSRLSIFPSWPSLFDPHPSPPFYLLSVLSSLVTLSLSPSSPSLVFLTSLLFKWASKAHSHPPTSSCFLDYFLLRIRTFVVPRSFQSFTRVATLSRLAFLTLFPRPPPPKFSSLPPPTQFTF